jgi:hypothetical protein
MKTTQSHAAVGEKLALALGFPRKRSTPDGVIVNPKGHWMTHADLGKFVLELTAPQEDEREPVTSAHDEDGRT